MPKTEAELERRLVADLKRLDPRVEVLKLTPRGRAGYQDRLLLVPGGLAVFVELKRDGERPRKLQAHRMRRLRALGFSARVVVGAAQAEELVEAVAAWLRFYDD